MPHVLTGLKIFRVLLVGVFLIAVLSEVCAQAPDTLFTRTYGGANEDVALCVRQTNDGGYVLAGVTQSFGAGLNDVYLIKTNGNGDTLWTKTYGGSNTDIGFSVQQTSDGGYIIAGLTASGVPNIDVYLIKTNSNGDTLWTKKFGGSHPEFGYSVQQTSDGGYVIGGYTTAGPGPQNLYIIKTDGNGDTVWTRTNGTVGDTTMGNSIEQTMDGGYIVGGTKSALGNSWAYLVKTDGNGDTLWTRSISPGTSRAYGTSVQQTSDGGYVIGGYINSLPGISGYLVKTNGNGDTIWTKVYGGNNGIEFTSVQQTSDGGYILTGYTNPSNPTTSDVYLVKTDGNGDTVWTKTFGGTGSEIGESVRQTSDSGYVIVGATNSFGHGNYDVYLIKTKGNINTQNSLRVLKLQDNDGNFSTTNDRTMKLWHIEVHSDSITGPLVGASDTSLSLDNLTDGKYCIREADSTNWIRLGYVLNGIPVTTTNDTLSVTLTGGQRDSIDFVNAPPIYSELFRTFTLDSLAFDKDNKGKVGKSVKRKAVADKFAFTISPPDSFSTLTLGFSMVSTGIVMQGPDTMGYWTGGKVAGSFARKHNDLSALTVVGQGTTGKPVVAKYSWAYPTKKTIKGTVTSYTFNQPLLPEPNRVNGLMESYAKVFATSGLLIGKDYTSFSDSAKIYGWLLTKKYTDVLKTIYTKGITENGRPTHGFDVYLNNGKPLVKKQTSLPPAKYNNVLLGDLLALKVNIAMSSFGMTPLGFGELLYVTDSVNNPLNGKMVKEISAYGDSVMMGWQVDSSYVKGTKTIHVAVHHFADTSVFRNLDSIIHKINLAFEGPIDTLHFSDSLIYKGTRKLEGIGFLTPNPNAITPKIVPLVSGPVNDIPLAYKLEQNYPNPFNPMTTIQFSLMNPSIVTLKVYNILGQEVATLLDHVQIGEGVQNMSWNANNLASGVYFYRLSAEGLTFDDNGNAIGTGKTSFQQVRKMVLIK